MILVIFSNAQPGDLNPKSNILMILQGQGLLLFRSLQCLLYVNTKFLNKGCNKYVIKEDVIIMGTTYAPARFSILTRKTKNFTV
jgi:hypothetical protein